MSNIASVISLVQRKQERQETVKGLQKAGLKVQVFESDPLADAIAHNKPLNEASDKGNNFSNALVSVKALEWALTQNKSLLFCEDDIVFADYFQDLLNEVMLKNQLCYLYCHDNSFMTYPRTQGFMPISSAYLAFTQCVFLPLWLIRQFDLDSLGEGLTSFDLWLEHFCQRNAIFPHTILPHPVQHQQSRTGRHDALKHQSKYSKSFVSSDL